MITAEGEARDFRPPFIYLLIFFPVERRSSGGHFTQIKHAALLRPISILGVCAYQSIGTVKQSRSPRQSGDPQSRLISGYWETRRPCHIHNLDIPTRLHHK